MKKIGKHRLFRGDCLKKLKLLEDNSIDSIVTDPPYGLKFMGKKWDHDVPSVKIWKECLRVLKPGGYLLAFAGTRTQHRMAVNIEDAGFEIRDLIAWTYAVGFPKSVNVGKSIDAYEKTGRSDSQVTGDGSSRTPGQHWSEFRRGSRIKKEFTPETKSAQQWDGWGTALKPALEPITVARKPLEGTVVNNVLKYGTGALNIDGCRVGTFQNTTPSGVNRRNAKLQELGYRPGKYETESGKKVPNSAPGRFPANFIHDGSEEVTSLFPYSKSCNSPSKAKSKGTIFGGSRTQGQIYPGESGSAARFFYQAKANKKDRDEGNKHPTVKPTDLMRYLVRLVTRKGGIVCDPFMGSGSTGKACVAEGMIFYGIEKEKESFLTSTRRIRKARRLKKLNKTSTRKDKSSNDKTKKSKSKMKGR